jgi:hypothetical protein
LHVRFDNSVGRFKVQKLCRSNYCNTCEANSKAREWTAVTQGLFLHGENEVQNKQGHHKHQ